VQNKIEMLDINSNVESIININKSQFKSNNSCSKGHEMNKC